MKKSFFIVKALMVVLTLSHFIQAQKITAVEIKSEADSFGGEVFVTIAGKKKKISNLGYLAWIVNDGREVVYSSKYGAGGFENEGQSLHLYEAKTNKTRKIMSEYTMVAGLTEVRLSNGKRAFLVRLQDGGLGGSYFAVVDPQRGQVFHRKFAELISVKGDTIRLAIYKADDFEKLNEERMNAKNTTAIAAKTKVKPVRTETYDLKKIIKGKIIVNPRKP